MKEAKIEIVPYLKGKIAIPVGGQINYRNHRKIVVIDGKIKNLDIGEILTYE